jgi:16S rRNA (cytidine1402-2'-O)-methyltransferase
MARSAELVELAREHPVALTSDAGTPAIADPGARLIDAAHAAGVAVYTVPGPSALAAALSVSGFQLGEVRFLGFLPNKGGQRRSVLEEHWGCDAVLVIYEAPTRVAATLADIANVLDNPETVACRELTKKFEETVRGRASELAERFAEARGEFVLVVRIPAKKDVPETLRILRAAMAEMKRAGARRSAAAGEVARRYGVPRSAVYELWPEDEDEE